MSSRYAWLPVEPHVPGMADPKITGRKTEADAILRRMDTELKVCKKQVTKDDVKFSNLRLECPNR